MLKYIVLGVLLTVSIAQGKSVDNLQEEIPEYECKSFTWDYQCFLSKLFTTRDSPRFKPYHIKGPENITEVVIAFDSVMGVLTSDLCDYFTNLKEIDIGPVGMFTIDEGALANCKDLRKFDIDGNFLNTLPTDLFVNNPMLETIMLYKSPWVTLPSEIFRNHRNLNDLLVANTLIKEFPFRELFGHNLPIEISTYSNYLTDFPIEMLVEKFPGLSVLRFNDNDIKCSRMREILDFLKQRPQIKVWSTHSSRPRQGEYATIEGGFICIP